MTSRHATLLAAVALAGSGLHAEIDPRNFDRSVDPAADFCRYATGTWLKNNPVPPEFPSWGGFTAMREETQKQLRAICERAAAKTSGASALEQIVGDFYASGIYEVAVEAAGLAPLRDELERIAAIQDGLGRPRRDGAAAHDRRGREFRFPQRSGQQG